MVRFFLSLPQVQMVFLRVIRGRRAGCDVRVFVCFFFLPLAGGGEIALSQRERNFLLRAQRRKSGVVVFCASVRTTLARFSRRFAFCGYSFARNASSFVRERRSDGWFLSAFTNRQKGGRGSRSAVFLFFFLLLVFHFSLTRKLFFFLKKHSHRKRRLKSRRSWARSKSKTARSRKGFA